MLGQLVRIRGDFAESISELQIHRGPVLPEAKKKKVDTKQKGWRKLVKKQEEKSSASDPTNGIGESKLQPEFRGSSSILDLSSKLEQLTKRETCFPQNRSTYLDDRRPVRMQGHPLHLDSICGFLVPSIQKAVQ